MNVLSLFDGMSCGRVALDRANLPVERYFASEIDKYATKVSECNWPQIERLGDVRGVSGRDLPKIDLALAGSPCQGFSFAGKQLNFDDPRSALFFEFVRILREVRENNPDVLFLLENVAMAKRHQAVISDHLGVLPIQIDAALVSAQRRKRLFWTNIGLAPYGIMEEMRCAIPQPEDRGILLQDILQPDEEVDKRYWLSEKAKARIAKRGGVYINPPKSCAITTMPVHIRGDGTHKGSPSYDVVTVPRPAFFPLIDPPKSGTVTSSNTGSRMGITSGTTILTVHQRGRGKNAGGEVSGGKVPTVTGSSWQNNVSLFSVDSDYRRFTEI